MKKDNVTNMEKQQIGFISIELTEILHNLDLNDKERYDNVIAILKPYKDNPNIITKALKEIPKDTVKSFNLNISNIKDEVIKDTEITPEEHTQLQNILDIFIEEIYDVNDKNNLTKKQKSFIDCSRNVRERASKKLRYMYQDYNESTIWNDKDSTITTVWNLLNNHTMTHEEKKEKIEYIQSKIEKDSSLKGQGLLEEIYKKYLPHIEYNSPEFIKNGINILISIPYTKNIIKECFDTRNNFMQETLLVGEILTSYDKEYGETATHNLILNMFMEWYPNNGVSNEIKKSDMLEFLEGGHTGASLLCLTRSKHQNKKLSDDLEHDLFPPTTKKDLDKNEKPSDNQKLLDTITNHQNAIIERDKQIQEMTEEITKLKESHNKQASFQEKFAKKTFNKSGSYSNLREGM